ncbi:SRPBCC family protein [Jiella sp. MQZ9-1]|uniref:SRPBCC family protein n=1 Tax=Jiella flava TaxID=2816857 RepID=A0A939FYP9_9HYPH|nr:SRPBCC family protein [Jiella flava]MBO0662635.1 SRPBCC family protein [Jiella flava]MCD2471057.1 SRPBCC family protein [Jiella flava]
MATASKTATLAAAGSILASPALAAEVSKSIEIAATPAAVWQMIGSFCEIQNWHPAVKTCEPGSKDGKKIRTLTLPDGGKLVEEEVSRDDDKMRYTYKILEGPLPVDNYQSTISVSGSGDMATVDWSGRFDPKGASEEKASEVVEGIYEAGLNSLKDKAGGM